jgi:hypothetical protein
MKAYREINKNPSSTERVKLALVLLVGFGAVGAHQFFVKHHEMAGETFWGIAAGLAVLSLLPGVGRYVYIAWMGLGITMGMVTQPIFLFVTYVFLFVPIGILFRLIARDAMQRKLRPREASYWEDYEESNDKATYFKQY